MNDLIRFKFFLWYFSRFKVPMIGYVKPRLLQLDANQVIVKLKLNRRCKNHLNSMYFGALSVGADIAGGLHGFYHAKQAGVRVSLAFKSFQAEFLRRPESDVFFIGHTGQQVQHMIHESIQTNQRMNQRLEIDAFVNYPEAPEKIAYFVLELSLKVIHFRGK